MICSVTVGDRVIASEVTVSANFLTRMKGLLGKRRMDDNSGMLLSPCSQVHTFFMHFPIDVIFLSEGNEILLVQSLPPGKISRNLPRCKKIIELNGGVAGAYDLKPGMVLEVSGNQRTGLNKKENVHVKG